MRDYWTRAQLRALLLDFDRRYGGYPEHEYEGRAVWEFLAEEDGEPIDEQEWEVEIEKSK